MVEQRKVISFTELLDSIFEIALDGGAGSGATAKQMIAAGVLHVHAFEPFEGNHRFFGDDPAITLHKSALGAKKGKASFHVASTVSAGTPGWEDHVGYSSVGRIRSRQSWRDRFKPGYCKVPVVRGDDVVDHADFIKLDLQGGEFNAMAGMPKLLASARVLWIELISDMRILDAIEGAGFTAYSTALLLRENQTIEGLDVFDATPASTGEKYLHAWKIEPWTDFKAEFREMKRQGLIQTDILALRV